MGHAISDAAFQLGRCAVKAAVDDPYVTESSCDPIKLYLWTTKFAFHVIFMCHEVFFFGFLSDPSKTIKKKKHKKQQHQKNHSLPLRLRKNRWWAGFGLRALVC